MDCSDDLKEKKMMKRVTFALDQDFSLSSCPGSVVTRVASSIGLPSIMSIIQKPKPKHFKSKCFKHHGAAAAAGFAAY